MKNGSNQLRRPLDPGDRVVYREAAGSAQRYRRLGLVMEDRGSRVRIARWIEYKARFTKVTMTIDARRIVKAVRGRRKAVAA